MTTATEPTGPIRIKFVPLLSPASAAGGEVMNDHAVFLAAFSSVLAAYESELRDWLQRNVIDGWAWKILFVDEGVYI